MIDFIKEINLYFNNIESKKFSCPFVSQNPYFFFFNKLNQKNFKQQFISYKTYGSGLAFEPKTLSTAIFEISID